MGLHTFFFLYCISYLILAYILAFQEYSNSCPFVDYKSMFWYGDQKSYFGEIRVDQMCWLKFLFKQAKDTQIVIQWIVYR